jgi:uncharacterized protein YndB with AHSA1/START domain
MNGTQIVIDNRPALRMERRLLHAPERVWRAVTEPAEMERWFVAPVPWRPELGEVFEGAGERGEITELEAPRVIAWTWADERYRIELEPDGEGTALVFTHVFNPSYGPGSQHAAGWEAYFNRLDAHLAGGYLSEEDAHEVVPALMKEYARAFGPLTLEEGPVLRLERRYDHSVERVWQAITDPGELGQWFPDGGGLEVGQSDPPRLLEGSWYGDALRFELSPDGDGCLLVFTHAFDASEKSARDAAGWECCFMRFAALLDGAPLGERESLEVWPALHEAYAERLGVDPALGREALAAHPTQQ